MYALSVCVSHSLQGTIARCVYTTLEYIWSCELLYAYVSTCTGGRRESAAAADLRILVPLGALAWGKASAARIEEQASLRRYRVTVSFVGCACGDQRMQHLLLRTYMLSYTGMYMFKNHLGRSPCGGYTHMHSSVCTYLPLRATGDRRVKRFAGPTYSAALIVQGLVGGKRDLLLLLQVVSRRFGSDLWVVPPKEREMPQHVILLFRCRTSYMVICACICVPSAECLHAYLHTNICLRVHMLMDMRL